MPILAINAEQMTKTVQWGIVGLGKIAHKMAQDLLRVPEARLAAVASRSLQKAQDFAATYYAKGAYGSYQELMDHPEVQVVYIATPHALHYENTLIALQKGKAVLCEKPLALHYRQVEEMVAAAQDNQCFFMEGLWTRFMPSIQKLLDLLEQKAIGEVQGLQANFGFKAPFHPQERLFNQALGGGALMDIGIYPAFLALLVLGYPDELKAMARFTNTGVDAHCAIMLKYKQGALATLESTLEQNTNTQAEIFGTQGKITLHSRFHQSEMLSLEASSEVQTWELPYRGNGYTHEIEEVNRCFTQKAQQSPLWPWAASLQLARLLGEVQQQIGLQYPR